MTKAATEYQVIVCSLKHKC